MYLLLMYLFLLFYQIQSLIFYYDTNTSNLNTIEYKYKNQNNHNMFIFLPGTSAYCKDYLQLFFTINNHINILCINYKNDLNSSIEYYKYNSFQDKGKLLEKSVYDGLKKIKNITNIDFLDKSNNQPKWNNIIASQTPPAAGTPAPEQAEVVPLRQGRSKGNPENKGLFSPAGRRRWP